MTETVDLFSNTKIQEQAQTMDQAELSRKENLYQKLRKAFPPECESNKVADYFSKKEIQQLYVVIRISYLRDHQVLDEFKAICQNQTIHSLLSFISSNDKKNLTKNMIAKIEKLKGGKK